MAADPLVPIVRRFRRLVPESESSRTTEFSLLERFLQERDESAFEVLVWRHGPMVLGVCRRLGLQPQDADDVFQATFLTLVRKARAIRNGSSLAAWLYKVAHRAALTVRQDLARRKLREVALVDDQVPARDEMAGQETAEQLDTALHALGEKYRTVFILCHLEGLTQAEAAQRLRCPEGTVASRLFTARQRLRQRLGQEAQATVPTAVPPALVSGTVRVGWCGATGAKVLPVAVATLSTEVLRVMLLNRMRWWVAAVFLVAVIGFTGGHAVPAFFADPMPQPGLRGLDGGGGDAKQQKRPLGGITTLYALDPLARTFCFADGEFGGMIHKGKVVNRSSDIDFHGYGTGKFSVGVEGSRVGVILDVGTSKELQKRYGYEETVGHGQGFASIRRKGKKLLILKDYMKQEHQEMTESGDLFAMGAGTAQAPVKLGHVYLIRLSDENEPNFERLVKMLVLAFRPGEAVTIRWEVIE